ncbi:MAG: ATP-binding protein, partial [Prochloraceae cyanobacterium]
ATYQIAVETGDFEYAGWSSNSYCLHSFLCGKELGVLETEIASYCEDIDRFKQELALHPIEIYGQTVLNLSTTDIKGTWEENKTPCSEIGAENQESQTELLRQSREQLIGEYYDERVMLPLHRQKNNRHTIFRLYINKIVLSYLFENYEQTIENATIAVNYLDGAAGTAAIPLLYFYDSLARIAVFTNAKNSERRGILAQVTVNQKKMKTWAHHAPENCLHKFYLVEAEKHRVLGHKTKAMEFYDRAIALAKYSKYLNEEALSYEIASKFYLANDQVKIAQTYMMEARHAYLRWGAKAKVKHLDETYKQLIYLTSETYSQTIYHSKSTSSQTSLKSLDLNSILKASQALASEIVLEKLLEKLMKIVLENAGAQTGVLLLQKENKQFIEASGSIENTQVNIRHLLSGDERQNGSEAIINYVERTKQKIVLGDATNDERFKSDPYILKLKPKSVLCIPIIRQEQLNSLLYLENNLTANAFTPERIKVLELLSAQIAISLENAKLYEQMTSLNATLEQKVEERTQELSQTIKVLKATQAQLVESEKMSALGSLVAGVAHEINTPLGIGVTASSTLAEKTQEFSQIYHTGQMKRSQLQKFLQTAEQSSSIILSNLNRAAELIQSFKQVAVDQSSESRRTFKIKEYLEETLTALRPKFKGTKHIVEIWGDESLILDSYPGALSQIVTNLVINSLIHAYSREDSGCIVIEFQSACAFYEKIDEIILSYTDNGQGIPPQTKEKIFEPFFTTKRGQGNSGLGLHLVYNLVTQKLQGTIECQSQLGVGTKFTITLPAQIT